MLDYSSCGNKPSLVGCFQFINFFGTFGCCQVSVEQSDNPLHEVYKKLKEVCNTCGLLTVQEDDTVNNTNDTFPVDKEPVVELATKEKDKEIAGNCERFYLKKNGQGRRFIPGSRNPLCSAESSCLAETSNTSDDTGFIRFGQSKLDMCPPPNPLLCNLRIKQIEPNPDKAAKKTRAKNEITPDL